MIFWYHDLYMDEIVAKNPSRCKKRVEQRKPWKRSYYAVTLAANKQNLFEIMDTRQLFFRRYAYLDIHVIGLAHCYESALTLLTQMIMDVLAKQGDIRPAEYFLAGEFKHG